MQTSSFESLKAHFANHDLQFRSDDNVQVVRSGFRGEHTAYQLLCRVDTEAPSLQVMGEVPVTAPHGARPDIAEALHRANNGLKVGKFEFDYDDGQITFQASTFFSDELDDATIGFLLVTVLSMLDQYYPSIMSVIYANESPTAAIRRAEVPA